MHAAWTQALITEWPRLTAIGPICGESSGFLGFVGHCPACPVGAALTLGLMLTYARRPAAQAAAQGARA
jgi:hypothetical protein